MSLKGYIFVVSIWGSCLKFLRVACTFCLPSLFLFVLVRLLPWDDLGLYLYLYLFYCACIFNSFKICVWILACIRYVLAYSILSRYVHKFYILLFWLVWSLCLHVQFPQDMCTSSILSLLTCMGFVPAYSIPEGYVHKWPWCSDLQGSPWWKIHWENDLLRSVLVTHGGAFWVISTYKKAFDGV